MAEWDGVAQILIVGGRAGLWGLRNRELMPFGALVVLRNATLEDVTWRTGAGATPIGSAITGTPVIRAARDYWPDPDTQRTLVSCEDGTLQKGDGDADNWVTLASGLTVSGWNPMWVLGGGERPGRAQKAFHADRINAVRVLAADGATVSTIAQPPPEWVVGNQPGWLAVDEWGHLWAGGTPTFQGAWRSLPEDQEDFRTRPYTLPVGSGIRRTTAALPYKGGLLVCADPVGVWWFDLREANDQLWRVHRVGSWGVPGPGCLVAAEDDVVGIDSQGRIHFISMTDPQGTPRSSDISARQLGSWIRDNVARSQLPTAQLIWDGDRQRLSVACHLVGQTQKNLRIDLDLSQRQSMGERWLYWDADRNEALFMRLVSGSLLPAMGDGSGRIWNLEQAARNRNGAGYSFEWFTRDTDLGEIDGRFRGRLKNLRFLKLLYDARPQGTHSVDIYRDGERKQTVDFDLEAGAPTLPVTLPFELGVETLQSSPAQRLYGQAERIALRGISSVADFDLSIAGCILGVELAA